MSLSHFHILILFELETNSPCKLTLMNIKLQNGYINFWQRKYYFEIEKKYFLSILMAPRQIRKKVFDSNVTLCALKHRKNSIFQQIKMTTIKTAQGKDFLHFYK